MSVTDRDPNGLDPHAPGAKLDAGKVRPELIFRGFARALYAVAEVATFGANKYTDDGWEKVPDGEKRYRNAGYRHMLARHAGQLYDDQSGLLHAAHEAWNKLAELELMLRTQEAAGPAVRCSIKYGPAYVAPPVPPSPPLYRGLDFPGVLQKPTP